MFNWLNKGNKIVMYIIFGLVIAMIIVEYIFVFLRPIFVLRLRTQTTQVIVDYIKFPLLADNTIQITINPQVSFVVNKLSFITYELVLPKDSLNRNNIYTIQFLNLRTKQIYVTYKINDLEKLLPGLSQDQIMTESNNFKTAAQEQYPNFDLFPYSTSDMKAQYDQPHVLIVYTKSIDSNSQTQALLELSTYLEKNDSSIQSLKDKGVQIEFKELPQDYSMPKVQE